MLVACRGHDRANISSQSLLAAQRGLDLLGVIKMSLQQRSRALKSGLKLSILGIRDQHLAGGVNHLLVPAKTGDLEEYPQLAVKTVDPRVAKTVTEWLASIAMK